VRIYVRAGSRYDGQHPGKAHCVEHILFTGTTNRNPYQIFSDAESLGILIQANTTKEYSSFYCVMMDRHLETGIEVLADVITNPTFDHLTLLKEKVVIMEEIMAAQDTSNVLWDLFSETLWVKNPIRNPTLGDLTSLQYLGYDAVMDFYRERYTGRNMVISVCGELDHDYVVKLISRRFSFLPPGEELRPSPVSEPPPEKRKAYKEKEVHQTYLIMGVQSASMQDEDRYAVKLMDRILGSCGSSRLIQRLRVNEKQVYSIYSVAAMYEDTGCIAINTACAPGGVSKVEAMILEEWERLRTEPVSDMELEAAKSFYEGTLIRECETNLYVAGITGIEALLHEIEPVSESIENIKKVTKWDIMEAANRYLDTDRYTLVTVGRK